MAWIESHQSLGQHPKLLRFADELGISNHQAIGALMYVWWWALDYAPDGDLSRFTAKEVTSAAKWQGEANAFFEALKKCVWIDSDGRLHDWIQYAGHYLMGKERQKRYRDKKMTLQRRNGDVTDDVTMTATIPTVPTNHTIPTVPTKDRRFQRPSPQEVIDYGKQIGYVGVDGQQFCDFYDSKGWKVGNTPMKDWKAAVRTWKKRGGAFGGGGKTQIQVGATGGFQQTKQPII